MIHYNILKTNIANKTNKLSFSLKFFYAASMNLRYSIRTLSAVAFLPSFAATWLQLISSKTLYLMIRCILCGMWFIHCSTSTFRRWAFSRRSSRIFSSCRNLASSL